DLAAERATDTGQIRQVHDLIQRGRVLKFLVDAEDIACVHRHAAHTRGAAGREALAETVPVIHDLDTVGIAAHGDEYSLVVMIANGHLDPVAVQAAGGIELVA
nr:hypothetical protein [Tanacetum cinerariifolium]